MHVAKAKKKPAVEPISEAELQERIERLKDLLERAYEADDWGEYDAAHDELESYANSLRESVVIRQLRTLSDAGIDPSVALDVWIESWC